MKIYINKTNQYKVIKIKKDNCYENYLLEVINNIKKKRYNFYQDIMTKDENFRLNLIKWFIENLNLKKGLSKIN